MSVSVMVPSKSQRTARFCGFRSPCIITKGNGVLGEKLAGTAEGFSNSRFETGSKLLPFLVRNSPGDSTISSDNRSGVSRMVSLLFKTLNDIGRFMPWLVYGHEGES